MQKWLIDGVEEMDSDDAVDSRPTVLVGIDGSVASMRASAFAEGVARRQGAVLVVLFVRPTVGFTACEAGPTYFAGVQAIERNLRSTTMARAKVIATPVEFVAMDGDPASEIVRVAGSRRVDHIIVGASAGSRRWLGGSVAAKVARSGRWPVTTVP